MSMHAEPMSDTLQDSAGGIFRGLSTAGDPRGTKILARTIYRELRGAGMSERDVLSLATELLAQTAADFKNAR
ncbi:MAG: hypothetical protein FJ096_04575 [Deltaproteobacteria bacterium]|nr:hypothetical protein [Deltaproteobacteria bacterium]